MADDPNNTARAGADPANKGQGSDPPSDDKGKDAKDAGADSSPEVVLDDKGKPLPWDQQPKWKAARQAEKKLQELLKANGLEDPDELMDLVSSGKVVRGKVADLNKLDEIVAKAAKLDSYEEYWAKEKEKRRKEELDPEKRAELAEQELAEERRRRKAEKDQQDSVENTKKALQVYEGDVSKLIDEAGVSKEHKPFILELFGVNNPANEVEITDKKAIKKLVTDGLRKVDAFKQAVISEYLASKKEIVKTGTGADSASQDAPKIKTLKDARKAFAEQMKGVFKGG